MHFFLQSNGAAGHALPPLDTEGQQTNEQTDKTTSESNPGLVLSHLSSHLPVFLKINVALLLRDVTEQRAC